jgi:hypothetical protein
MNKSAQMVGVWCGLGFVLLFFFACWPMAHFMPPPSPLLTGDELLAKYSDNIFMIRASMPAGMIAGVLVIPFTATMAIQLARLEGRMPVWAITCVGAGAANAVAFYLPFFIFATAYYRLDRSPELIQLMSDLAWIEFLTVWPPVVMQMLCVAIVGLTYKGPLTIIPRWFSFLSLWMAFGILPAGFVQFFKTGPFAWNGIIGFWLPAFCFGGYFLLLAWIMRRAVLNHAEEYEQQARAVRP